MKERSEFTLYINGMPTDKISNCRIPQLGEIVNYKNVKYRVRQVETIIQCDKIIIADKEFPYTIGRYNVYVEFM